MAKKKAPATVSLAANRKKRKARRNPADPAVVERMNRRHEAERKTRVATANPPVLSDLTNVILPGFGAYAASRVFQRIAFTMVGRRWPKLAKHTHAASGLAAFGAAWLLAHRWARLAKYHDGILVGTGVAALQGVAQAYLPAKYNWLLADCKQSDVTPTKVKVASKAASMLAKKSPASVGDEYSYLEDQLDEAERAPVRTIDPPRATRRPIAIAMKVAEGNDNDATSAFDTDLSDLLEANEGVDDLFSGVFEQN